MEAGEQKPSFEIAQATLPKPLLDTIGLLMRAQLPGCALVGGTALSGFYTGHRRSDDIDLFAEDEFSFEGAVRAFKNLAQKSLALHSERKSGFYYRAACSMAGHNFTVDVVRDDHLFVVGHFHPLGPADGLRIADLPTLLKMKAAALVSRCSEKDLSDLLQLFKLFPKMNMQEFISLGASVDSGVQAEPMLASLAGTTLRKESCDFSLAGENAAQVLSSLEGLREKMVLALRTYLKSQPTPALGELVRQIRKARTQ